MGDKALVLFALRSPDFMQARVTGQPLPSLTRRSSKPASVSHIGSIHGQALYAFQVT